MHACVQLRLQANAVAGVLNITNLLLQPREGTAIFASWKMDRIPCILWRMALAFPLASIDQYASAAP